MPDQLLWRRLTETDFKAIHGKAAPSGSGGGAVHIALAAPSEAFKLDAFLGHPGDQQITAPTAAGPDHPAASLNFLSNPHRRAGEWIIQDQYSHRHPAWSAKVGFPTDWLKDEFYVLVFRVGSKLHVRWRTRSQLKLMSDRLPDGVFTRSVGIGQIKASDLPEFQLGAASLVDAFEEAEDDESEAPFDPADMEDGRKRVFRSIRLRQGQPSFRKKLLKAYGQVCAFTGEGVPWVLDAAHIVPYFGPKTNHVTNGLLLRSDVHTLFDLGLIAVEPRGRTLRVSTLLKQTLYWQLNGQPLREAKPASKRASPTALAAHFATFKPS